MQWNSPKNAAKTGGPAGGWSPQPMAATTGAGYRPMVSLDILFLSLHKIVSSTLFLIVDTREYTRTYTHHRCYALLFE